MAGSWRMARLIIFEKLESVGKGSHHLKKTRILRKTFSNGGEGSVRFPTLIQKWSKVVQNGPNGPKMHQIT